MIATCKLKCKYLLFCAAEIKMPSGNIDKPIIEDNRDGTVSVKYEPREEGLHELSVKYNGEHVQGQFGSV
jgi:filamin